MDMRNESKIDSDILSRVTVASPCSVDWDTMSGDERVRFCQQCTKHVYNLSEMSEKEAKKLVLESEGKTCVRFYLRKDGSIMTEDCPVGLRVLRDGYRKLSTAAAALVSILLSVLPGFAGDEDKGKAESPVAKHPERTMGEMMVMPTETPNKPWMLEYKKAMVAKVVEKLPKNLKSDSPQFLVEMESSGKVLNVTTTKCSVDQSVASKIIETIRTTKFSEFPKETDLKNANFKLTIKY